MSDFFAKASIFALVAYQLRQSNPELLGIMSTKVDTVRNARVPAAKKRDFLDLVWRETGTLTLLEAGQNITNIGYDPIWQDAVQTANPEAVFKKWRRFEKFGHSRNRMNIEYDGKNCASFQRYVEHGGMPTGEMPTTPENLLICGLIIALLEIIGCKGLSCNMRLHNGSTHQIRHNKQFFMPHDISSLDLSRWSIEWQSFSALKINPKAVYPPLDILLPASVNSTLQNWVSSVVQLLLQDVSHSWTVGSLAKLAGVSKRTFQRRLNDVGLSFSHLVRLVRIHEACRLLKNKDISITTIGYCSGFSDSAHFSRDFLASMGMTPSDYRSTIR